MNRCINSNYFTLNIEEGTARVSWVNGSISLHQVLIRLNAAIRTSDRNCTTLGTEYSNSHGVVKGLTVRIADCNYPFTRTGRIRVTKLECGEDRSFFSVNDAQDCQI